MAYPYLYSSPYQTYNKPMIYKDQATLETVNAGIPYYVASPKYGYEGVNVPVAGSVSKLTSIDQSTGEYNSNRTSATEWVTCTASRYQFDKPFKRCSLADDGVLHQTYNPRMAFTTPESAMYYAETGKPIPYKPPMHTVSNIYLVYINKYAYKTLSSIHQTIQGAEQAKLKLELLFETKCSIALASLKD